ncbi:DUF1330 domain-containing protein [Falsiphaeobacter marinintestinus]|uniref:DUF1330 domain-containing protein n=1 Tax=Falsiphaeobacter marinintestinus TaxID=1492905 RepID=UPI0011B836ED|nr:DUF1330 domain-containing protein [Phaeobacter marinintestinus]
MPYNNFTREGFAAFKANASAGPIQMLNFVRLREQAVYDDGTVATGPEAYAAYGRLTAPLLVKAKGHVVWRGQMEQMAIGPEDEVWDLCFIVEYPTSQAFIDMVSSAEYREAVVHRQAAVSDSRLIRMAPLAAGQGFATDTTD